VKILIVIDSLSSGGAQKVNASLAFALVNREHQVNFFTYKKGLFFATDFQSKGIKIYSTKNEENGFSMSTLKRLRGVVLDGSYDGVISSMHTPSAYAALAMIGIKRAKLIVCQESSSNAPLSILRKFFFYFAALRSQAVVTKTFDEAKNLKGWHGLSTKVHPIWNGFKISEADKGKVIIRNKILKLLVVARVAYPKNGVNLLKAIALFQKRNGWVPKVEWAGRRADTDKNSVKMQDQMDQFLIDNPEIASNWIWLGEVKDVQSLYQKNDALILASIYEGGVPAVICEAMIENCFVIASDICDNSLVIKDGVRGLLCNPLSSESICRAIEQLSAMNLSRKSNMIKNAREFAELNFDQDSMASAYESLLTKDNSR
jgi:glycosyltransferase involved in cell wall biosynthesis